MNAMSRKKIMVIAGTRPEAVKLAPLLLELGKSERCRPFLAVTGQHREMLRQTLSFFGLEADADLDLQSDRQTLADVTAKALVGLMPVLAREKPDAVVVQGDTTSTFVGALAAFYSNIPVFHLEAGLRTGDLRSPFPEEANRRLTSVITSLHLAATQGARANLILEGVSPERTLVTGNTVIDALRYAVDRNAPYAQPELEQLESSAREVLLVTAHRRESWGAGMDRIGRSLSVIAKEHPSLTIVFPIHKNPVVRESLLKYLENRPNVIVTEPLDYGQFCRMLNRCTIVLTDSGGVQEEAPALGKPVVVMRDTTERPEAVDCGAAELVGTDERKIVEAVAGLLRQPDLASRPRRSPYGDGHAARRCVLAMEAFLFGGPMPEEFEF